MVMNIDNYEDSTDAFTFAHNPRTFDAQVTPNKIEQAFPTTFPSVVMTDLLKAGQGIVLVGHTDGSNKDADYRSIYKHFTEPKLKKLTFSDGKFYLGMGNGCKKTHSGGRTNFVDYVANFSCYTGIIFGAVQASVAYNNSSTPNAGNAYTPIEYITGSVTSGTTYRIYDSNNNGFQFTASGNGTFTYKFITVKDLGGENLKTLGFVTGFIGSVEQQLRPWNNLKSMILGLAPGQSMNSLTITESPSVGWTFKFRDGWTSD